jgi:hypothetical protein
MVPFEPKNAGVIGVGVKDPNNIKKRISKSLDDADEHGRHIPTSVFI